MPLIKMFDAISADKIPLPAGAHPANTAVASYCDHLFAGGWIGCVHRFPELAQQQRVLSIASDITTPAWRIMDYESGNRCYGDPDGVALAVLRMLAHGIYKPGAYANRSDMPALQRAWVKHNVPRHRTVLWLAAPGVDPTQYLNQGFDAVQDHFDGEYDVSVCKESFFPSLDPPKPPAPLPAHSAVVTFKGRHHGGAIVRYKKGNPWRIHALHKGDWTIKGQ